jgi:hypothetical protein
MSTNLLLNLLPDNNLYLTVIENLGEVDILLTFLPELVEQLGLRSNEVLRTVSEFQVLDRYPLTRRILTGYIK